VLRLLPLLCSLLSVPLFYWVAGRAIDRKAVPLALLLFAISPNLIRYAAEVKQYAMDVLLALALSALALEARRSLSWRWAAWLGVAGGVAVWLSHPAAFVLAGVGGVLGLDCLVSRQWRRLARLAGVWALWSMSFAASVLLSPSSYRSDYLIGYWNSHFMPFPPRSVGDWTWLPDAFLLMFSDTGSFALAGLAALAFLFGCVSLFARRRHDLVLWLGPLLAALAASAWRKYPFGGRLLLFALPSLLLLVAEGVLWLVERDRRSAPVVGAVLIGLLAFDQLRFDIGNVVKPRRSEDVKLVLGYMREHWETGDRVYLYYDAEPAFDFYARRFGFAEADTVVGVRSRDCWRGYREDLDTLRGTGRVWVLFSHVHRKSGADEEKLFLFWLDERGRRLDSYESFNASVHLYDLGSGK
jgi:hypothetical protein